MRVELYLVADARGAPLLHKGDAHRPRSKIEHRLRLSGAYLGNLRLEVGFAHFEKSLPDDFAFVGACDAGDVVFAALIVRDHHVDRGGAIAIQMLSRSLPS